MRLLFEIDKKDHENCTHTYIRNSARALIIEGGKLALIHSLKYDYYKPPGGGIEPGEDPVDAMIRETREEAGLVVIPASVREYGCVRRVQKGDWDETERFQQDNYYYICRALPGQVSQSLDEYEAEERFTLEYVDAELAIRKNRSAAGESRHAVMLEREARVLELLRDEGYLD